MPREHSSSSEQHNQEQPQPPNHSNHAADQASDQTADRSADRSADRPGTRAEDWRRVETGQAERAELGRKHDATHEPSPEFEHAARPPGAREHRPERIEVEGLTPEERAEIEEFTGQSAEHVVQRRNHAHASYLEAQQERPNVELRDDLPADHSYNTLARSYQNGTLDHDTLTRYLDHLDLPELSQPRGTDQPAVTRAPIDQGSPDPGDGPDDSGQSRHEHPAVAELRDDETQDSAAPDQPAWSDRSEHGGAGSELGNVVAGLRTGELTSEQAADRLEALEHADQANSAAPGEPESDVEHASEDGQQSGYASPTDVRDALLGGASVAEVRREVASQPTAPEPEPTTELVREQDGYRYEKRTPEALPSGDFDPEELSKLTDLRRTAWRHGSGIDKALDQGVDRAFDLVQSLPPGGTEQRQPPEIPQYGHSRPGADAGDVATAAMVVAVLSVEAVRKGVQWANTRGKD